MADIEKAGLGDQAVEDSEEALILRARASDPVAWESLVRDHQEHVFRLAYLTLQDAA